MAIYLLMKTTSDVHATSSRTTQGTVAPLCRGPLMTASWGSWWKCAGSGGLDVTERIAVKKADGGWLSSAGIGEWHCPRTGPANATASHSGAAQGQQVQ